MFEIFHGIMTLVFEYISQNIEHEASERSERASNILRLYLPTVYFYGGGWRLFFYSSISLCSRDFNSFMALVFEYIYRNIEHEASGAERASV